jgi:hypothetical protein
MNSKLKELGFGRFNFQIELAKTFLERLPEQHSILLVLEHCQKIVGITNKKCSATTTSCETSIEPQIQRIVEIDVAEDG